MRDNIIKTILSAGLIAIVRGVPADKMIAALEAIYAGGVRLAEITYDKTGTVPPEETARQIGEAAAHFRGRMYIGAGTVMTEKQLQLTEKAGGSFVISPHTDPSLIRLTRDAGLVSIPGAMTVTEIVTADAAGADFIKVFPASVLGPTFFKSVLAPLPDVRLLAVSGVGLSEIPDYRKAGAAGFGIGGAIVNGTLAKNDEWDTIHQNAAAYVQACSGGMV